MERFVQPWKLFCMACGTAAALSISATSLKAETANPFPTDGTANTVQDPNNIFNNSGDASSIYGLINRIQLLNGRNSGQFAADQNEGFQSAVEEFRKKQQQQFQGPVLQKPAVPNQTP